ncbi:DUF6279 family lipoprotein [Methylibium rhizosphaerae]|uniref:DUF6279 family lipoprotein n=1 Tax=Methylibium rhizosphaerae TaxID=2570323 RepID=UPI00112A2C0D|nr:DUF6279 family lipoprotein [Methylibium rhizosphaerae]
MRLSFLNRGLIIGVLMLLLAGCSAVRFAYNQAPELVYWRLDGYVDFDGEQAPPARGAVNQWFEWHRNTQLPDYATLLVKLQAEVQQPTTAAQVCRWWDEIEKRRDLLLDQATLRLTPVALTLKPEQFENIEERYAKSNKDFRKEYLQEDPQDRREAAVKRVIDRSEILYGRIEGSQRELIERQLAGSPFDPQRWYNERRRRQQDVLQTLRQLQAGKATAQQAQPVLRALAQRLVESPDESYRRYMAQLTAYNCEFAAQLHNATTPAQRRTAAGKLKGWEADLRALVSNGT